MNNVFLETLTSEVRENYSKFQLCNLRKHCGATGLLLWSMLGEAISEHSFIKWDYGMLISYSLAIGEEVGKVNEIVSFLFTDGYMCKNAYKEHRILTNEEFQAEYKQRYLAARKPKNEMFKGLPKEYILVNID